MLLLSPLMILFLALHVTQRDGEFSTFSCAWLFSLGPSFLFDGDDWNNKQLVRHWGQMVQVLVCKKLRGFSQLILMLWWMLQRQILHVRNCDNREWQPIKTEVANDRWQSCPPISWSPWISRLPHNGQL